MNRTKLIQLLESQKTELLLLISQFISKAAIETHDANDLYQHFVSWILLNEPSITESKLVSRAEVIVSKIISARDHLYEASAISDSGGNSGDSRYDQRLNELTVDDLLVIINANQDAHERLLLKLYYHGTFSYNLVECDVVGGKKWLHLGIDRIDAMNDYLETQRTGSNGNLSLDFISEITRVPTDKIHSHVKWQVIKEILDIIYAYKRYLNE
jgi:hypothetical protein